MIDLHEIEISIGLIEINSSYVCLKRTRPPFENAIEFPGGKLESGETAESCLYREIKEELNIDIQKSKYIGSIKHLYSDRLIKINIFRIFKFSGEIISTENREIVFFDQHCLDTILPTHYRILNILKIPRLLKILTMDSLSSENLHSLCLFNFIRLRDISYFDYEKHFYEILKKYNFKGKLIVDYPYNEQWDGNYFGIHYKSNKLKEFDPSIRNKSYIYSASCHTYDDVEISNKKNLDFILVSPVIDSHSSFSPLGWDKFDLLSKKSFSPTLALGGLKLIGKDFINAINNNGFGLSGIRLY